MPTVPAGERPLARLAGPGDDVRLLEICRSAPVRARVRLWVDRSPRFFEAAEVLWDRSDVGVLDRGGEPVAFAELAWLSLPLQGEDRLVAYGSLGAVRGDLQGRGLTRPLFDACRDRMAARGCSLFLGLVNDRNDRIDGALARERDFRLEWPLVIRQVVPSFPRWTDPHWSVRRASPADAEPVASLLTRRAQGRIFGRPVSAEDVAAALGRRRGLAWDDVFVACDRRGCPTACAALWDQSAFRRYRVMGYSSGDRWLLALWRAAAHLRLLPAPPDPGEVLSLRFTTFIGGGDDAGPALRAIWSRMSDELRWRGVHFFLVAFDPRDPLASSTRGFPCVESRNRVRVACIDRSSDGLLAGASSRIPWIDYAIT